MAKSLRLSPLALDIATQMNAGKSLDQFRALRPDLTDQHIAAAYQRDVRTDRALAAGHSQGQRSDSLKRSARP